MAPHDSRSGGLESMLGKLADTEGRIQAQAAAGIKDMAPKDLHRILMSTLITHGLQATAQCLRSEAELDDVPSAPAKVHRGAGQGAGELSLANNEAHQVATAQRRRVAECVEVVSEQRQRLDALREKVKQLHEARGGLQGGKVAALAGQAQAQDRRIEELQSQCEQLKAMEVPLREELRSKAEEAIALKELIAQKKADEAEMRMRLQQVKQEVAQLRIQKEQQVPPQAAPAVYAAPPPARAAPVSPTEQPCTPMPQKNNPETDKLEWIIAHWDHQHGPVLRVAPQLFSHADTDHDGRLRWNEGEIRQFVHDLFNHYELHLPQWQDHVWYELYRQCDRNMDYALQLPETVLFAKHCFELALHSYVTVVGPAAHQPLGHGYKELEVAATIQSVLASALNPSTGGALYNVSVDIFQQLDYNHDGRIEWNNGEVKGFVTNLFSRYGVPMPQWPDQVWYDMYHKCDIEGRHSINLQEGMMFARHCFEAAMHALVITTPH